MNPWSTPRRTALLGSHVTIHNVTGNIEDGISDNDLAGVGHCIQTEDHERAFLIDVVHVVDTIGNDALDHLVGLLQSVDAVGFFCEQLNGILSVQETQELFCQFGVLGVGRNLKLLNGAHNIAGLAVIQNGCAGQTKLKAVSTGSIGHFAFHPVAVGDEQSLVHHHVSLALGMVQSNGAIHQVAIGADLCHVLEDLEGLIRAEGAGRVGGDCLHVVDAGGRCQRGPQHLLLERPGENMIPQETLEQTFKEIEKAPTAEALEQLLCLILQERMGLSKIALSKFKKEVQAVIIYVNAHYMDKLTLDGIADYVGLNREYLSRLFSKETGTGLFQYINEVRMKRAGEMIRSNKQVYIKEVAAAVGFDDPYFFSRKFKEFYGKTPSEYAEG